MRTRSPCVMCLITYNGKPQVGETGFGDVGFGEAGVNHYYRQLDIYMKIVLITPYLDRLDIFVVDRRIIYRIV